MLRDLVLLVSSLFDSRLARRVWLDLLFLARQRVRAFDFLTLSTRLWLGFFAQLQSLDLLQFVQLVVGRQGTLQLFLCLVLAGLGRFVEKQSVHLYGDVWTGGSIVQFL